MGASTGPLVPEPVPQIPVVEKKTETHETTTTKGAAEATKADTTAYDDRIRARLAGSVFLGFLCFVFWVTIKPAQLPGDTLGIILGAFISLNGVVVGYYYQSSSGSTAKGVALEKKGVV